MLDEASLEKIAERLTIVREVQGLTQTEFSSRAGINKNAWNNYERARKRINLEAAIRLVATFELTLDYIYLGDTSNLKYRLSAAIEAVRDQRKKTR